MRGNVLRAHVAGWIGAVVLFVMIACVWQYELTIHARQLENYRGVAARAVSEAQAAERTADQLMVQLTEERLDRSR